MLTWARIYYPDEDVWMYFEIDTTDDWAPRQIEIRRSDGQPTTAACLAEVMHARDHGGFSAVDRYEGRYGVVAEGPVGGWEDQPEATEITQAEFEQLWERARRAMDDAHAAARPPAPA
ncbi:hypothetical protein LRS74_28115 [Streptomyces sp. LX-29]|uniref:hypothetical protein n=1 Tax=Streptomyces sp. LX-29 TaxID=2900152 RepID=UPI00240DAE29|nr:hypothetical protein [Streptomyces sp. LX-29]WFB10470.1 hypothetical protein LRS74_28115 [Streptomyces sp. LX-29]